MEYTTLGPTGTEVSRLCLGTWRFGHGSGDAVEIDERQAHALLDEAAKLGINFIDTANQYGDPPGTSETYIGDWLESQNREDYVIASKVGQPVSESGRNRDGVSRKHVRSQIEGTLDRLGTDYVDLYYIHRLDDRTPVGETMRTLHRLVEEGLVRYLGASTMAAWELTELLWESDVGGFESIAVTQPPVDATLQNWQRYDRFDVHRYLEVCRRHDLGVVPYSPLAGGFLTDKYDRDGDPPSGSRAGQDPSSFEQKYVSGQSWAVLDAVREVASEVEATPAQVSLRWVMDQAQFPGGAIPVVGARTREQLEENAGAVEVELTESHRERIDEVRGRALLPS